MSRKLSTSRFFQEQVVTSYFLEISFPQVVVFYRILCIRKFRNFQFRLLDPRLLIPTSICFYEGVSREACPNRTCWLPLVEIREKTCTEKSCSAAAANANAIIVLKGTKKCDLQSLFWEGGVFCCVQCCRKDGNHWRGRGEVGNK